MQWQNSGGTILARVTENGYIGIGADPAASYLFRAEKTVGSAGEFVAFRIKPTNISGNVVAMDCQAVGFTAGTIASVSGGRFQVSQTSTGTVTGASGIWVQDGSAAGTITTLYGLYIANQTAGATNYAIYTGSGQVRFGDALTVDGSADAVQLTVQANGTQTGNLVDFEKSDGTVISGVDSLGRIFSYGNAAVTSNFITGGAGNATLTGTANVLIGDYAGENLTEGDKNFFLGAYAGRYVTTGEQLVLIGRSAGQESINSEESIGIGENCIYNPTRIRRSVFLGKSAGFSASNVTDVVAIGHQAGYSVDGDQNVLIGANAGNTANEGCVMIGHNAGQSADVSNQLFIHNSNTATPLIYGEFDTPLLRVNGALDFTGFGAVYTSTRATILAGTPVGAAQAYATDTEEFLVYDGSAWMVAPLEYNAISGIDMGAMIPGGLGLTDLAGYYSDAITDKRLSNVKLGGNALTENGGLRIDVTQDPDTFEIYLRSAWQTILYDLTVEYGDFRHAPISEEIYVWRGDSVAVGLDEQPQVQEYEVSMGAYGGHRILSGGTF
jgi:hypothetical protein